MTFFDDKRIPLWERASVFGLALLIGPGLGVLVGRLKVDGLPLIELMIVPILVIAVWLIVGYTLCKIFRLL